MTSVSYSQIATLAAGVAGVSFIGYCLYFDRKRRCDPLFKQKLKERRLQQKEETDSSSATKLPDMKDQEAVQKFFLDEVTKGEEFLAMQDYPNCIKHLTNAIVVCGQPQQLLQVFKQTLPPEVFQALVQNIAMYGASQMQRMQPAQNPKPSGGATVSEDIDGLD